MRDKTKEKDKSFRLREILIVVIFAAVALAVGGITVINYLRSGDSDTPDLSWSSYEECVNSFGEYALPEEKNSYYVYFPSTEKVSIVKSEDISSVGGYVYEGNKSHIQITCPLGSGEVVGYSETLEDDISEVFNLKTSARLNLESDGLERRFVNYILFKTYPSSCIISGGKCFRFSLSGREEITSYENYRELFVSDTIDDGVMTLIEKFAYIENIKIADCGDYFCSSEGIYDKNAVTLVYLYPWVEEYSCPDTIVCLKEGCFKNCARLKEIEIPYTAQKISSFFDGESGLKKIIFTSAVLDRTDEGLFDGCNALEEIEFPEGVKAFVKGTFSGCSAKNVFLPRSAEYLYIEGSDTVFYVYSDTAIYGDYAVLSPGKYTAVKAK